MHIDSRPRLAVLGLDGLPFPLAKKWAEQGLFPNLTSLALSSNACPLQAERPELSPVNWTSFFTGKGPGDHGIFGFTEINHSDYTLHLANFKQVRVPTVFDILGEKGLTSKVVNLPNTYPVRPIKGMLVSGFPAADMDRAFYPPILKSVLGSKGYLLEADTVKGATDHDFLLAQLSLTLDSRNMALDMLWPDLGWDLFVMVLTETDRLGHFLFPALSNQEHLMHNACMRLLNKWDRLIGRFLELFKALPEPKRLIVLADHGFTDLKSEVDLNAWLAKNDLLCLGAEQHSEWASNRILPASKAFSLDSGRIYIHTKDSFPLSIHSSGQKEAIINSVIDSLYNLQDNGSRVIEKIVRGRDFYTGISADRAPDLLCIPAEGYDLKGKFDRNTVFGFYGRSGVHSADNAFYYDSSGFQPAIMREVGQQIPAWFGVENLLTKDQNSGLIIPG